MLKLNMEPLSEVERTILMSFLKQNTGNRINTNSEILTAKFNLTLVANSQNSDRDREHISNAPDGNED